MQSARSADTISAVPCKVPPRPRYRLGVVVDSFDVQGWIYYLLEKVTRDESVALTVIVLRGEPESSNGPILLRLWSAIDRRLRRSQTDALSTRKLLPLLSRHHVSTSLQPAGEAIWRPYDKSEADRFDLLLNLCQTPLPPAHRASADLVWSVRNDRVGDSSLPATLWDMLQGNCLLTSGPELLEQTATTASVRYRASGITSFLSLALNENVLYWDLADFLLSTISNRRIESDIKSAQPPIGRRSSQSDTFDNIRTARFLGQWAARTVSHEARKRLFREQWAILLRPKGKRSRGDSLEGFALLQPTTRDRFYADPFLIEQNGRVHLFFEEYGFESRKGVIAHCEVKPDGTCTKASVVLERDYHLSYPFVFVWGGDTYLIPETRDNRTIELYRAEKFPGRWALAAVLMRDVVATDTTLVHHHGKWWMFTAGVFDHTSPNGALFLFYSDSPLGPWHAHPKNPVVRDARMARPAGGLYVADGMLVRPGQDCSRGYGSRIQLQKIELLTDTEYRETPLGSISAERIPGCCGVHTFNQSEHFEVVDAKFMIPRFSYGSFR